MGKYTFLIIFSLTKKIIFSCPPPDAWYRSEEKAPLPRIISDSSISFVNVKVKVKSGLKLYFLIYIISIHYRRIEFQNLTTQLGTAPM